MAATTMMYGGSAAAAQQQQVAGQMAPTGHFAPQQLPVQAPTHQEGSSADWIQSMITANKTQDMTIPEEGVASNMGRMKHENLKTMRHYITFAQTFNGFAASVETRTWNAHARHDLAPNMRLIPVDTRVTRIQNTSGVAIGVNFKGLEIDNPGVTGTLDQPADYVIPALTATMTCDDGLYTRTDQDTIDYKVLKNWAGYTAEMVAASIVHVDEAYNYGRGKAAVLSNSPIMSFLNHNATQFGVTRRNQEPMLFQGQVAMAIDLDTCRTCQTMVNQFIAALPLRNPIHVSATITRLDRVDGFNEKEGLVSTAADTALFEDANALTTIQHISMVVEQRYIVWDVDAASAVKDESAP